MISSNQEYLGKSIYNMALEEVKEHLDKISDEEFVSVDDLRNLISKKIEELKVK